MSDSLTAAMARSSVSEVEPLTCTPCVAPGLAASGTPFGPHPCWHAVAPGGGQRETGLCVTNSLTGEKVPFVPRVGNRVTWYTCGPTVYDVCHMGHARAYVTMDILRRILEDHFGYEVFMQVNVTDIDDKIILRARRNKLLADYAAQSRPWAELCADVAAAVGAFEASLAAKLAKLQVPLESKREEDERKELLAQQQHKVSTFAATKARIDALLAADAPHEPAPLIAASSEALAETLDRESGAAVTQHAIFEAHARKYEAEFIEDMAALGVRLPDALTRVTEYVPKIIDFVQRIVDRGCTAAEPRGAATAACHALATPASWPRPRPGPATFRPPLLPAARPEGGARSRSPARSRSRVLSLTHTLSRARSLTLTHFLTRALTRALARALSLSPQAGVRVQRLRLHGPECLPLGGAWLPQARAVERQGDRGGDGRERGHAYRRRGREALGL